MRKILLLLLSAAPLMAWQIRLTPEMKAERADWIGTGVLGKKSYVRDSGDRALWKVPLKVTTTEKGNPAKEITFFFEQRKPPSSQVVNGTYRMTMEIESCSDLPVIQDGEKVRVFLTLEKDAYFLPSNQMLERPAKTE